MSVAETAVTGDRLSTLVAMRARLAAAIDQCESMRDLAALSREYRAVLAEIAVLEPPKRVGDAVDEIAQRRAARRPGAAKGTARAARAL